jgi:hypothetical protein
LPDVGKPAAISSDYCFFRPDSITSVGPRPGEWHWSRAGACGRRVVAPPAKSAENFFAWDHLGD